MEQTEIEKTPDTADDEQIIKKGQKAWKRIKNSRDDWRAVGDALRVGRKLHSANKDFGKWCKNNGFGDMSPSIRSHAIWLAENWDEVQTVLERFQNHMVHPKRIRQAFEKAKDKKTEPNSPGVNQPAALRMFPLKVVQIFHSTAGKRLPELFAKVEDPATSEGERQACSARIEQIKEVFKADSKNLKKAVELRKAIEEAGGQTLGEESDPEEQLRQERDRYKKDYEAMCRECEQKDKEIARLKANLGVDAKAA